MNTKIEREILRGERYINEHPILAYSPSDLTHSGSSIESFLAQWPLEEANIWLEYFEDELPRGKAMPDLYEIAAAFRAAIEEAIRAGEIQEMMSFPSGCCGLASDLLQRYLFEQHDIFTWYMSGRYGYGESGEGHAWLETQDGTVIDITGDQYKHKKLKFTEPVYIGQRSDGFHDKFKMDEPVAYSRDEDPLGQNRKFDRRYEAVIRRLRE